MADKIKLVQNDSRPFLAVWVTDSVTSLPLDFSDAGTVCTVQFRAAGSTTIKDTLPTQKLPGTIGQDGLTPIYPTSYNLPGSGGRLLMTWNPTTLDTAGEFEGDVVATYSDGTKQTSYGLLKFTVRSSF